MGIGGYGGNGARSPQKGTTMIRIGQYEFDGPVYNTASLRRVAGVYAVLDDREGSYHVLDIGESESIRDRIEDHDRETCWRRNRRGRMCFAALYLPQSTTELRRRIESQLRQQFTPTCGIR